MNLRLTIVSNLKGLSPFAIVLGLVGTLFLSGCDDLVRHQKETTVSAAEQKQSEGDFQGAICGFERCLDGSVKSAEAHFRLGLLYYDKLRQPLGAAHHFRRYLLLAPNGRFATEAKADLERAELAIASSLGGGTLLSRSDALKLRSENAEMRRLLAERNALGNNGSGNTVRVLATNVRSARDSSSSAALKAKKEGDSKKRKTRKYTVRRGDTLGSISLQAYRKKSRWKSIERANASVLGDPPKKLKPGMVLVLPD